MRESVNDSLVQALVDNRYLVRARVARGGMSTVYLATDTRLDRDVALKVLYPHLAADPGFLERFEREAKSAARLSHPHVVGVLDQGIDENGLAYLVMEYVPGRTLRDLLRERGTLTPRQALALLDAVVEGLAAAHDAGLIHRDVKPENVLLSEDGRIKIADFGLARAVTTSTNTGTLVGTVAYLAPELVTGGGADERSDVYSAGIMLYELLTGSQPFTGDVPIQVAFQHVHGTVPPPSEACPGLAEDLDELVQWCTRPDPEDRPVDGRALLGELRHIRTSLTDEELDVHCLPAGAAADASATAAVPAPDATDATEVISRQHGAAGATEVIDPRAGSTVPLAAAGATEILSRQDNATAVFPAARASRAGQGGPGPDAANRDGSYAGDGNYAGDGDEDYDDGEDYADGTYGEDGRSRRRARRDLMALQKRTQRDARRPELSLRRNPRRRGIILGLLVAALVGGAVFAGWFFGSGPGALVIIPDVANASEQEAEDELGGLGLRWSTDRIYHEAVPAGLAVGTDPAGTEQIRRFQAVTLLVSRGPELFAVPNLIQRTTDEATQELEDANLALGTVTEEYSETVPAGEIISQDPRADAELRRDTPVAVSVSKGPAPVEVPAVAGLPESEAVAALEEAGLTPRIVEERVNSATVPEGGVVAQSPAGGTLERGGTVTLTLSKGPRMVEVPSFVGRQAADARRELEALGFRVEVNEILGGFFGTVRAQDPVSRAVPEGSVITLTVV